MNTNQLFGHRFKIIIKALPVFMFLISSTVVKAQQPADFSGKWEFDKARSDKDDTGDASFDGTIILEIKQNPSVITFANTYIIPGRKDFVMKPDTFLVDGTVTPDNGGTGPAKKFVKWSQDKKILTTNLIMTDSIDGEAQDFLTANTYRLADDRKTLFIEVFYKSKLNGEKKIKKVYKQR